MNTHAYSKKIMIKQLHGQICDIFSLSDVCKNDLFGKSVNMVVER